MLWAGWGRPPEEVAVELRPGSGSGLEAGEGSVPGGLSRGLRVRPAQAGILCVATLHFRKISAAAGGRWTAGPCERESLSPPLLPLEGRTEPALEFKLRRNGTHSASWNLRMNGRSSGPRAAEMREGHKAFHAERVTGSAGGSDLLGHSGL